MTRRENILRNGAVGLVVFLLVAAIAAIITVQTDWFRNYVRGKIITSTQESIGGRVEVGSFTFDWQHLEATIDNFVIHGSEPSNVAPFLKAAQVRVRLHLLSSIHHIMNIGFLGVEQPELNVLVAADGSSNVPTPPHPQTSDNTTPLQTLVDLAIGRFELNHGSLRYNSKIQPLDLQGNNLAIQLSYNLLKRDYEGQVSLQPFYVAAGRSTPVVFSLNIPITLEGDRIAIRNATVTTPLSELRITGAVENLHQPKTSAQIAGHVSLVDLNNLGNLSLAFDPKNPPSLIVDASAAGTQDSITLDRLHAMLGGSTIDAKQASNGQAAFDFTSTLDLEELSKLAKSSQKLTGVVGFDGRAAYQKNIAKIDDFTLRAFGGEIKGNASIEQWARYQVSGQLSSIDIQTIQQRLGLKPLPYSGGVSGSIEAKGDLRASTSIEASAALTVAPGRKGIPVSGKINARYNGSTGDLRADNSNLRLPHTSVNFRGSLRDGLHLDLTSRDLNDVLAAVATGAPAVKLNGGQADLQAVVSGTLSNPNVKGHLAATRFVVEDRQFDGLSADFVAGKSNLAVSNGSLNRAMMLARFSASVGLSDWSPLARDPLSVSAAVTHGDLADILALAGQKSAGYSGELTANINIGGTIGNPTGSADVQAVNGTLAEEPFDIIQAQIALADQKVSIPSAMLTRDMARVNLSAEYSHSRDSFTTGHLTAHLTSNSVDLSQMHSVQKLHPNTAGTLQVDLTVAGDATEQGGKSDFLLSSVAGNVAAKMVRFQGEDYGDLTANASTSGNSVTYTLTSNFAGSQVRANGRTQLIPDYPTTLDATVGNLPLERVLAIAKRSDIPAKGMISGTAQLSGTLKDPRGSANVDLTNAVVYDEPLDRLRLRADYLPNSIQLTQLDATSGPSRISLTARYDHPVDDFNQGNLQWQIDDSRVDLGRIRNIQKYRPGLGGAIQISGSGKGALRPQGTASAELVSRILVENLNAKVDATSLTVQGKNLGNLNLAASTSAGRLNFTLQSSLANASIRGTGAAQLSGDYPLNAELTFNGLTWANLQPLLANSEQPSFDATTSGRITIDGPALKPDQMNGSVRVSTLQIRPVGAQRPNVAALLLQNQGDLAATLQNGLVRIESAHLTGPQTDISASGTASLRNKTLDLRIDAKGDLALLQTINPDVYSSGNITVATTIRGTTDNPSLNGRLELKSASVSYADLPAGLANANGVIVFNGNTATIQSLTGESGGGKVNFTGFVSRENQLRFGMRATASGVRIRVQEGVSIATTANLSLTGTAQSSLLSGAVTIDRLTYLPQTDIGSLLSRAGPPVQAPAAPSPILSNMRLDISVRTSSATSFQASLAQNLQVSTDLRVRGLASQPGVTGSVQMNHGQLVFFGSSYKISTGNISFYNPTRIEPILNITLETQAKGVTVVLTVTGPIDDMKLSYTSDPPLQFDEIVELLAAGKAPTSDPTLLANQPSQPPQNFQQRGESAILDKALADPVSSRLQRVFGVSQLKIDPSFTSGSQLPQARVTLQQQVATNIVFTYVTALDNPNTQVVRIEWAMTPQWSAIANRDENGLFSVNLQYTKQFR